MKYMQTGAVQLLLGFNAGWYNDNGSSIKVEIIFTKEESLLPDLMYCEVLLF